MLAATQLRSALRWLIRADLPAPPRTDAEITAEVEQNYRWNFTVNLLDGVAFWFGASFISSATIVPLFISQLTDSAWAIGVAAMIAQGSWFAPQLFTANHVERLARKKPVVVNLGLFLERIPLWLMPLAALLAVRSAGAAVLLFLLAYAWHGLGAGVVATAWQDMVARCFPVDRRGRFLGITMFLGAGSGLAAASLSAWFLERFPFPLNFAYSFGLAALFISLSWLFLALTREPAQPSFVPRQSSGQYMRTLPDIVRRDDNFRRFLLGRLLLALGGMGTGFVTVTAVQRWQIPNSTVGLYTLALLIGQTVGNLFFGLLADRRGHKLSLELSGLTGMAAFVVAWLATEPVWYYAAFVLLGVTSGGVIVSGILVVMEFCQPEKRPTYVGLANTAVGIISLLAPLFGAALASYNANWLFAFSALFYALSFIILRWWVREPRFNDQ
ncbi:MAG: MFS transporter [Chloroflexi bacterium]|nr:MFS transporter [Chloroflexota bacterium]